jgi:ABC-type phosphate transport system substrate-binding protein
MKTLYQSLLIITVLLFSHLSQAEKIAIIVHLDNHNSLERNQVRNIFLGKTKVFPDGQKAQAYGLAIGAPLRERFNHHVLHKSESNLSAYWARMIFSSRAKPPTEVADQQAVLYEVSQNKDGIGYIDANMVNDQVRVVLITASQ